MEYKQIQELIKTVNKSNIGELTIEEKDFKITIKQKEDAMQTVLASPALPQPQFMQQASSPITTHSPNLATLMASSNETKKAKEDDKINDNLIIIKSPMIGTFYRRSSPDKPLLAEVGSEIKVGQPLCIIEAMKLFNEIESEVSGTIIKTLVEDASPVEYDQPLFLVEPN